MHKKYIHLLAFVLILFSVSSCMSKGIDPIKIDTYSYGILSYTGDQTYILCDDNGKILLHGISGQEKEMYLNQRIFVSGKLSIDDAPTGYNSVMIVKIIEPVRICNPVSVEQSSDIKSFGTDGIFIDNQHLNDLFSYYGNYANFIIYVLAEDINKHTISYVLDKSKLEPDNKVTLYLRHKINDDSTDEDKVNLKQLYTSINIKDIIDIKKSKNIKLDINYIDLSGTEKSCSFDITTTNNNILY